MPEIDPEALYTVEASYPEGAIVGWNVKVLGRHIRRAKRSLKKAAEEGYRIRYHIIAEKKDLP